jgi:seryl-tRNA synthetase
MAYRASILAPLFASAIALTPLIAAAQNAAKAPAQAANLDAVVNERIAVDEEAKSSQERINQLDDETQKLLSEYRKALSDAESYARYADQLEVQVRSQDGEIAEINRQLLEVESTSREIAPLMQKMLATLDQFVALDVPFLGEERANRVAMLKEMMTRADVTFSEKYRRILEAYQVEMEYGRTIEAYEAKLPDERTVQFLRVGRVSLLYQTLDGNETAYWDAAKKQWVVANQYAHGFKEGIAVAKKVRAPEMLLVPVSAPKEAKS